MHSGARVTSAIICDNAVVGSGAVIGRGCGKNFLFFFIFYMYMYTVFYAHVTAYLFLFAHTYLLFILIRVHSAVVWCNCGRGSHRTGFHKNQSTETTRGTYVRT